MKRFVLIFVIVNIFVSGLSAQERLPTPSELKRYADIFWNEIQKYGEGWERKRISFNNAEINSQYATLGGDIHYIDTPLEATLAAYFVWNIFEPFSTAEAAVEAIFPHSNPRLVDRQLGTYVYMNLVILRFLGNTEAVGRYETMLNFIVNRGNTTRAEIETFYRNGIRGLVSETVYEEFNKTLGGYVPYSVYANSGHIDIIEGIKDIVTSFLINPNTTTYAATYAIVSHFLNQLSNGLSFAGHACDAYTAVIASLSPALFRKMDTDLLNKITIPAEVRNDPTVKKVTQNVHLRVY